MKEYLFPVLNKRSIKLKLNNSIEFACPLLPVRYFDKVNSIINSLSVSDNEARLLNQRQQLEAVIFLVCPVKYHQLVASLSLTELIELTLQLITGRSGTACGLTAQEYHNHPGGTMNYQFMAAKIMQSYAMTLEAVLDLPLPIFGELFELALQLNKFNSCYELFPAFAASRCGGKILDDLLQALDYPYCENSFVESKKSYSAEDYNKALERLEKCL